MSFIVRSAKREDVQALYDLARQFSLLNLPADRDAIEAKVERSRASFRGELAREDAEYMFVLEDRAAKLVVGSSMINAKSGTKKNPNFIFKIIKKEHFSHELGVGFIHQLLRLYANVDGPTEVGGLVVDRGYRRRPEKTGRLISLSRFVYLGMRPERFEENLHAEMASAEDGHSEFWEALGRRFTGMPYQEADQISGQNNAFIPNLFPSDDIYLALLDAKARLTLGKVGAETEGALHLLNRIGFTYKYEVDPFDGGPHLGCKATECTLIKNLRRARLKRGEPNDPAHGLVGLERDHAYHGTATGYQIVGEDLLLPEKTWTLLGLNEGEEAFVTSP